MELPVPCAELISVRSAVRIIGGLLKFIILYQSARSGKNMKLIRSMIWYRFVQTVIQLCTAKKDGIYTIEELTELMNKTHRELYSDESVVASYEKYLNEVGK